MPLPVRPMDVDHATLIYDGECGFCRQAVALVSKWDRERRVTLIPFQEQARVADAAPDVLRLLPGKRWLASVFALPGVLPVARRIYAWVARRRHCLVREVGER